MHSMQHGTQAPSPWVTRWAHLVKPQGSVLDVAGGHGRHSKWFFERNHPVAIVDIDFVAIESVASSYPGLRCVQADIEHAAWPLLGPDGLPERFDAVVVTNYIWRPLFDTLFASLSPSGVYIHETFAAGNETVGKPSRPDFLLQPAELFTRCQAAGLRVVAFEDGFLSEPDRFVQRVVAARVLAPTPLPSPASPAGLPKFAL